MSARLRSIALCALLLPLVAASAPPTAHFTMDQILSAPYIGETASSADGSTVGFMAHERGERNVYVARLGNDAHRVTNYTADDGQDINSLAFTRDGSAVAYVRGQSLNGQGEAPNPVSLPTPPDQEVWIVSTASGHPYRVGSGHSPAIAPDSKNVVWISRGQVTIAPLRWKGTQLAGVGRARQAFKIRGSVDHVLFSPDGSRIAFSNDRGDHSFVVVYGFGSKRFTYLAPAFTHDYEPAWSPDGRSVAFLRLPGTRENEDPYAQLNEQVVEAPFEIWIGDSSTGQAHRLWQADPGMGSEFYELDAADQLFWGNDGAIAFVWEKTGWRQLYAVPASGGAPVPLTAGDFEVESAVASTDRSHLYYATNEGDIDRRHIWSVGFDGAPPVALSSGNQSQWFPAALAGGAVAFVNAGWADVPQVQVRAASGRAQTIGPAFPASFPKNGVVQPQLVTFNAPDGLLIHAQLFVPNDGRAKHCAIVFDHGGSERQLLPGFHYMEAYANLYEENQYLVNRGCVVMSINYRSGIMYGHDFRRAKHQGPTGGAEYQDVLAGAGYLATLSGVDPDRMGIYGLSYGGYLTAMGLAHNSDIFKVGFDMAGVHNWQYLIDSGYGHPVGTPQERQIAFDSSPVAALATWRSPVFLAQGDDDRNVDFAEGVDLAQRLRAQGVEVQTMVFPNEIHEMTLTFGDSLRLFSAGAQFLLAHLGGDTSP
ncbi:MAG TPA: prolyl oligopeptidase family serine peptidase [Verrucomicrobiae bacterium]|jgi:dipeptidyl aminopeptidase/acylaminoacyl peptidase|nr:prolyl oligopeptidase family serine peptidase [Verrucomicrobiae bacterium]